MARLDVPTVGLPVETFTVITTSLVLAVQGALLIVQRRV
jgi:hypothetical protein